MLVFWGSFQRKLCYAAVCGGHADGFFILSTDGKYAKILSDFLFRDFSLDGKVTKRSSRLFCHFSKDGKVTKRSFPTVSAAARARSPQPSARPAHATSGDYLI